MRRFVKAGDPTVLTTDESITTSAQVPTSQQTVEPTLAATQPGTSQTPTASPVVTSPTTSMLALATGSVQPSRPTSTRQTPTLVQNFTGTWPTFPYSPDRVWKINGNWDSVRKSNAHFTGSRLELTTQANVENTGEFQTVQPAYGQGYYEVRMKTAKVAGVCQSFFGRQPITRSLKLILSLTLEVSVTSARKTE